MKVVITLKYEKEVDADTLLWLKDMIADGDISAIQEFCDGIPVVKITPPAAEDT